MQQALEGRFKPYKNLKRDYPKIVAPQHLGDASSQKSLDWLLNWVSEVQTHSDTMLSFKRDIENQMELTQTLTLE